jgi:hypothetical protein
MMPEFIHRSTTETVGARTFLIEAEEGVHSYLICGIVHLVHEDG